MPTFLDRANLSRDLRILPTIAPPLPQLSTLSTSTSTLDGHDDTERYDIVVVGVCPNPLRGRLFETYTGLTVSQ